ncbi:MAG: hypothetical protein P0Y60_00390 [Candidatus Microbacterium colombiense]|nr:MAG: hypothetical protein P0Y60_00390 [Microbacterium sp.]
MPARSPYGTARTDAVANAFGYPRQRAQPRGGEVRESFFFPHQNDTGYWWQGENANLGSLAFAARAVAELADCSDELRARLRRFAADQVHWVLGRNPFDVCMLQGRGRHNVEHSPDFPNVPGGIVNGIRVIPTTRAASRSSPRSPPRGPTPGDGPSSGSRTPRGSCSPSARGETTRALGIRRFREPSCSDQSEVMTTRVMFGSRSAS